jgi:hypothetical protein
VYRGAGPLSEPETAALAAFVAALEPAVVCSVHTHGDVLMFPFGFGTATLPQNQALYEEHGRAMAEATGYRVGSPANLVGLGNGSAIDHHHALCGAMAWTPEIGPSFWPPTTEMHGIALRFAPSGLHLVRVAGAWVEPLALETSETAGDGDGFAEPGETAAVDVLLRNCGLAATAGSVGVTIACTDPRITVATGSSSCAALGAASDAHTGPSLALRIAPDMPAGTEVQLDVAVTFDGFTATAPLAFVAGRARTIVADDFEQDLGWTAGLPSDTAFTGRWTRGDPVEITQGGELAQPADDHTPSPGSKCYLTGNAGTAAGMDDVDEGVTTLVSPRLDLAGTVNPRVRLHRWYWCSKSDDPFRVDVSNDDGVSWTALATITGQPNEWLASEWGLAGVLAPTDRMRLRFVAEDPENDSVTEALIDDFEVVEFGAAPRTSVVGKPKLGGQIELQIAGTPQATLVLFSGTGAASLQLFGLSGAFGIAPATIQSMLALSVPQGGLLRIPVPVPDDPALAGMTFRTQVIELGSPAVAGNVAEVTVVAG